MKGGEIRNKKLCHVLISITSNVAFIEPIDLGKGDEMRKKSCAFFVAFIFVIAMSIAAVQPTNAGDLPRELRLGTNPMGSVFYACGAGLANVIGNHTPITVKVVPAGGPTEYLPLMTTGEMDLGIINHFDMWQAYYGKLSYKKPTNGKGFPIRLVQWGSPNYLTLVTADPNIKKLSDIKGKRIAGAYKSVIICQFFNKALLANAGLTADDVTIVPVATYTQGVKAIVEGKADVAIGTLGSGVVKEMQATKGGHYIPIDSSPAAIKRMQDKFVGSYAAMASPGKGLKKIPFMAYGICLIGRETLKDNTVYAVMKSIWENTGELGAIHAKLKSWKADTMANMNATIPYHNGAIKWFKEKKVWTPELDKLQKKLLSEKKN